MIAADTSVLINYFKGNLTPQTDKLDEIFVYQALVLPPVVVSELLSDPHLSKDFIHYLKELPILSLHKNYWARVGQTRSILLKKKLKARLADAMIAQSCIDHHVPLMTEDGDFQHFHKHCGLKLF
jgi:predicted nucleic acid-binding protein